jgi:phosphonate transport system ATP-binding protein
MSRLPDDPLRIDGMSGGSVVYDGDPAGLSDEQLKAIYGGKDWLQQ